ncbi:PQQ-dependent sugar dehydrogenase [Aurantibacter crassamenti]|uniref:PQQ-dependent sugar dehydrogenase n=1 Tax=Aurantibacter crassamenti TaxID=1837375 RepID=UPI0019398F56|nr:PQQ-dependent sugar dehydrogenase [Aurantibacter crassamenti]MBM1107354.1 PQQ-dependent sugar dehydrogenase [Aurantibacter crassamenti]
MNSRKFPFINTLLVIVFIFLTGCKDSPKENKETAKDQKDKYAYGEMEWQQGMEIFNEKCASCHNFEMNEIGPNLSGITSEVDKDWLKAFIHNPQKVIESGDERAVAKFETFKLYMPPFPEIQGDELENLLGFIHRFSEAEKKNKNARPGGLINPIPEKLASSNLNLVLEEWLTIPASADKAPLARINTFLPLKTDTGERLFISDLRGELYEIVDDTVQVYLDLSKEPDFFHSPGWGNGLGSFAFHPEFEKNGLLYTTHTVPGETATADFAIPEGIEAKLQWVITEWKTENPSAKKYNGTKREVVRMDMYNRAHGLQEIVFNPFAKKGEPDYGLLYLGIGDGTAALAGHPELTDSFSHIWSSILRIDPLGTNGRNGNYGIPEDNPFVGDSEKLDEIWARGFRNPHRFAWNEKNPSQMLVSNIGQHSVEEVNLIKKGADYGWPNREGSFLYDVDANTELVYPLPEDDSKYTNPVIQYDHDEGNAVCGGYFYNGDNIPLLKGKYIFGDIPQGTFFYSEASDIVDGQQSKVLRMGVELNGKTTTLKEITKNTRVEVRMGQDSQGELYIFTKSDGKVYKVIGCNESN